MKHRCTFRLFVALFVCLFISSAVFGVSEGYSNRQKIYPVDSDLYQAITYLYIAQGHALPSTTGPWSADELDRMLAKIDREALSEGAKATYDYVKGELDVVPWQPSQGIGMKWGFEANLETYTHINTDEMFQERVNWGYGLLKQKPMLKVSFETWPVNSFYGYAEFSVGNSIHTEYPFGSTQFNTNIIMFQNLPKFVMADLNFNMPYRAFASAGGNHWSLQVGRDRMSWGPGVTGNFVVGDNLMYHNMARFTTYFDSFKYTFVTSFFPHPENYSKTDQEGVLSGINMFMSHRLEWRMFKDKVNFALTEAIMYQSADNYLDLQILNPCMIFHDYYIRSNANSILSIELDYTPIKYLNIYGQFVVDELALPGEPVPGSSPNAFPNAFGYMLGVKSAGGVGDGMLYGSAEWAMTDPYLYLRYGTKGSGSEQGAEYGLNWVVATRNYSNTSSPSVQYDETFLGYKYGGDAIVANLNGGFKVFDKWYIEGNIFYMAHGTHDKWTRWARVSNEPDDGNTAGTAPYPNQSTPTDTHYPQNSKDTNARNRNAVSHTLVAGVNGGYTILPGFNVFGQLDFINVWNPGNIKDVPAQFDMQLTVGLSYSL